VAIDRTVQQPVDGGHLPPPTHQIRLGTLDSAMPFAEAQQTVGGHRLVGTLNLNQLGIAQAAAPSTSRAVDALSITPPGGATDSIRCAIPTCPPTAV
jgi:hypothetical protein